jgi:hypothetical protein
MKTVLSGVAIAAILALAMPAWADGPGTSRSPGKSAHAGMSHAKKAHAARGSHTRKMSRQYTRSAAARHGSRQMYRTNTARMGEGASPTDNVANQLNRAESQRLMTGGSMPPMGGPNMAPMGAPPPARPIPEQ